MKKLSVAVSSIVALVLCACPSEKVEPPKPVEKPIAPPPPPPAPPPAVEPPTAAGGTGAIKGVVSFAGTAPKPEKVDMKKDPKCAELNKAQEIASVVVTDGKLADVFVRIATAFPADRAFETRTDPITMDQKACVYVPRMIAIQVDQPFVVINSDPLLHNVHAFAKRSEFNQAMPKQDMKLEKKFKTKDFEGKISCEVHPWMHASLRVVDHPFFSVTGMDGTFTIEKVPAGKYTLELEHEKLGKQTLDVEVKADATAEVSAKFGG